MNCFTSQIPLPLAEKLKEKGMLMEVWNGTIQGMPYINVMEKSSFDFLDKELGNAPSEVEVRYSIPTFGACFDWIMSIGFTFYIDSVYQDNKFKYYCYYLWDSEFTPYFDNGFKTWHEAAEAAIEKALELI